MSDFTGNAKIDSTDLGFHDGVGSIPNFWLRLSGEGWVQGFGGYALGGVFTHKAIYGILNTLEVESWEKLTGQLVRFRRESDQWSAKVVAIGHPIKDKWFDLAACAKECQP